MYYKSETDYFLGVYQCHQQNLKVFSEEAFWQIVNILFAKQSFSLASEHFFFEENKCFRYFCPLIAQEKMQAKGRR